ncbi:DUF6264 family protein [Microbacterium sp. Root61]|uniref:DUF6264 family protein n=1 Tax=Microbacterium sp. Root61 TaxID=1736570 RepID=UPI000AB46466|nr:DUF6264 family protein [Microbacterium sp. Root61]
MTEETHGSRGSDSSGDEPRSYGTDEPRPRPQYGEYATPEEQRARIQYPDASYAIETGQAPDPVARAAAAEQLAAGRPSPAPDWIPLPPHVDAAAKTNPGRRRVDLIIALALLGYGLVNVILTIVQILDFPAFAQQFMSISGIDGEFTNTAAGQLWGGIAAVVFAVGWLVTALFVYLRARRGKRVWWIPIVGAAVTFILFTVCVTVPLMGDPVIFSFFSTPQQP